LEFSLGLLTNFNGFITTIQLAYSNGQQAWFHKDQFKKTVQILTFL
jgi:hypothetical protein